MVAGCGEEGEIIDTMDSVMDRRTVELSPNTTPPVSEPPVVVRPGSTAATAGMVLIPAGSFQMGSNDPEAFIDEQPVRNVYLNAFYMDRYEVTNAQYRSFVLANSTVAKRSYSSKVPRWRLSQTLGWEYLSVWEGESSSRLCELGCSEGVCDVGGETFADGGGMGKSSAWWIGRSKISARQFDRCQQRKLWRWCWGYDRCWAVLLRTVTACRIWRGTCGNGVLMCMIILKILACCEAVLGVLTRLTCGSLSAVRIFLLSRATMSVFVVCGE